MKTITMRTLGFFAATSIALLGCPSDDTADDAGDDTTDGSATNATATNATVTATTTMTTTDPDTSATMTTEVDTSATGTDTTAGSESTTVDQTEFQFNDTPPDQYTQVDRKGFPGVNTALNIFGDKNAYNAGSPEDDAMLDFAPDAIDSLQFLHWGDAAAAEEPAMPGPGLDDDLEAAGLDPCTAPGNLGTGECLDPSENNGGGFAIPDVVKIDTNQPAGFPNGRALRDPVIDIILAVLLLDLDTDQAAASPLVVDGTPAILSFTALENPMDPAQTFSLNPPANDVAFSDEWPYLAPAHE